MTFEAKGWANFPQEPAVLAWVDHAFPAACAAVNDPAFSKWHQCEGTWFVGLEALPNDAQGRVGPSAPLSGKAVDFIRRKYKDWPDLHRGQVSVTYPGYPRPRDGENEAGFQYRLRRDAAHVDGVIGLGTPKRRFVQEPHHFILGIALTDASPEAAPLVAWEGSHTIMQSALSKIIHNVDKPERVDVTEAYVAARKQCFNECRRVALPLKKGEAVVLHRMTLHGVGAWSEQAQAERSGRMIAYFRPPMPGGTSEWAMPDVL